jgi:transcriptional regulator of acetoin/glycerol metabolism
MATYHRKAPLRRAASGGTGVAVQPLAEMAATMMAWERFVTGEPPAIAQLCHVVVSSWQRSLARGVDPAGRAAPLAASGDEVEHLRLRHGELLSAAAGIFAEANEMFAGSRSIMLLTNPDGVVLEAVGDMRTLEEGQGVNLIRGGHWDEGVVGTNGIGTALATGQPAHVHAAEHFCEGIKRWTCAAAPVYQPGTDAIMGVVDISGPPNTYQRNNLALAVATARQIETLLGERAARERMRLLEVCLQRLSSTDRPGLIAIDRAGRLVHAAGPVAAPVNVGEPVPGLTENLEVEEWASRLPAGWRQEWFNPVRHKGRTIGAVLVIPDRPRSLAGRVVAQASEADAARSGFDHIIGRSDAMAAMISRARHFARRRVPVLIDGATGTGKELLARAIHGEAPDGGPFIAFNCGAVSRELVAGELFGHVPGAFTGATAAGRPGRFELAHKGTLCLDEIGEMPLDLQPMLLRVLEEGVVYRLGDTQPRHVDVRLIAITNRNLRDEIAAGRFRRDLFHRVSVAAITVPPLRARGLDIDLLVGHFSHRLADRHQVPVRAFSPQALAAMRAHAWLGNVRELRNVVETLLLMGDGLTVQPEDLSPEIFDAEPAAVVAPNRPGPPLRLDEIERETILCTVRAAQGNLAGAARRLGISRSTLYRKMAAYGLEL